MKTQKTVFFLLPLLALMSMAFGHSGNTPVWTEITIKEYDALIKKATRFFDGDDLTFSVDVSFSSYNTHTASQPHDTKKGYYISSGKNYHHYLMGVHSFQNRNYRFVVDSTSRNILVATPANQESEKIMLSNYGQFHSYIEKVQKMELKDTDRIKVSFKKGVKLSHIEMEFDKTGLIRKSVSYFSVKFKPDPKSPQAEATAPRMETVFSHYKTDLQPDYKKEFDESAFFTVLNGKFMTTKKYSDYKIKDTRLKTK